MKRVVSDIEIRKSVEGNLKMMENKECSCKKECERHGKCDECRKYHAESKRQRPVACERKNYGLKKLFGN